MVTRETHIKEWLRRATDDQWYRGYHWYTDQHEVLAEVAEVHHLPLDVVAAIVAVLSPRVSWAVNVKAAVKVITTGSTDNISGFMRNRIKAVKILETGDVGLVSGPKVTPFFNTLLDPEHAEVTVDQWAVRNAGTIMPWNQSPGKPLMREVAAAFENVARDIAAPKTSTQAVAWVSISECKDWKQVSASIGALTPA